MRIGSDTLIQGPGVGEEVTLISSEAGQLIAKAGWNYLPVEGDGSEGVHNPSFVLEVIEAAREALE